MSKISVISDRFSLYHDRSTEEHTRDLQVIGKTASFLLKPYYMIFRSWARSEKRRPERCSWEVADINGRLSEERQKVVSLIAADPPDPGAGVGFIVIPIRLRFTSITEMLF